MNQHVSLFVLRRVTVINYARYSKEYMIQNQSLFRIFVVVLFVVIFFPNKYCFLIETLQMVFRRPLDAAMA